MAQKRALLEAVAYNTPGVPHPPFAFTPDPQGSLPSALRLERQALKGLDFILILRRYRRDGRRRGRLSARVPGRPFAGKEEMMPQEPYW